MDDKNSIYSDNSEYSKADFEKSLASNDLGSNSEAVVIIRGLVSVALKFDIITNYIVSKSGEDKHNQTLMRLISGDNNMRLAYAFAKAKLGGEVFGQRNYEDEIVKMVDALAWQISENSSAKDDDIKQYYLAEMLKNRNLTKNEKDTLQKFSNNLLFSKNERQF
ncbi:hypothetical protein KA043_02815 [Candidatus Saccharibacteria bacterium]|nr:hypothetical protein [Candidatus Saccharibacteria bacterium]